jgi:hypothetical protein
MATPTNLPASFTSGNVLTAAQMNDLRGAFRILQVVSATTATQTSSTSASFVNTALVASITPQSSTSKIFALVSGTGFASGIGTTLSLRLVRDTGSITALQSSDTGSSAGSVLCGYNFAYLDSPATTSSVSYRTQLCRVAGAGPVYDEINGSTTTLTLFEVSA